ncbi:cobalamin-dependent protein [Candidatus Solincola tengchongensis]|uniref:cobalamin B12-binding domain-containing protein n=1 Tax=Candidatus Solincola tengchongensis TaxID=2900693 RepID=UPI00257CECCF|nr:cobalamin-dependent protein [Candidatus Solincola tengchongensis]
MSGDPASLLVELKEREVLAAVRESLERGEDPLSLVESLREGMEEVGRRFERKDYYLSELIMSAEIFKQAMALIEPRLEECSGGTKESVVIGTVKGDIHDIGKNLVSTLLRCDGFRVHDLGVDVPPTAFVDKLKETGARLLALSGLLTLAFDSMRDTVEAVADAGLRERVKVIIGGKPVDGKVLEYVGADAFGKDAAQGVRLANTLLGG